WPVVRPLTGVHQFVDHEAPQWIGLTGQDVRAHEHPCPDGHGAGPASPEPCQPGGRRPERDAVGVDGMDGRPELLGVQAGGSEGFSGDHPTTTLTRRGGLAMTLRTSCPSMNARAFSDSRAMRSASSGVMSAGTSIRSRTFPLIWITSVTVSSRAS